MTKEKGNTMDKRQSLTSDVGVAGHAHAKKKGKEMNLFGTYSTLS